VPKINQAALFNTYDNADSFDTCGGLAINNWNCNSQHGEADPAGGSARWLHGLMQVDLSVANVFKDITYWSHIGENSTAMPTSWIRAGRRC
jgi:hypothetical protein